jgi:hypothetical protein
MARKWKTYVDPITKEKRKLITKENCTESWTTSAAQKRESLDKSDSRDQASSLFVLDKLATHLTNGEALRALYTAPRASANQPSHHHRSRGRPPRSERH